MTKSGVFLHEYFKSNVNTYNYLHPLIQKGAKNTINITNQHFLENKVAMPFNDDELESISKLLLSLNAKVVLMQHIKGNYEQQKQYLLRQMFIQHFILCQKALNDIIICIKNKLSASF